MKEITVMGSPLFLRDGIVRLTEKQAGDRRDCLKPHKEKGKPVKDCYEITAETCFKVGEVISYTGDIDAFRPEMAAQKSDEKDLAIEELKDTILEQKKVIVNLKAKVGELEKVLTEANEAKTDKPNK
ncbi:MAG: hypothetical protein JRC60_07585 [Deltaproteobacteria bacterium]|nr:hypothetical protein [Deltaproteobacteria bacterium]